MNEVLMKDDGRICIKQFVYDNNIILYKHDEETGDTIIFDNNFNLVLSGFKIALTCILSNHMLGGAADIVTVESIEKYGLYFKERTGRSMSIPYRNIISIKILNEQETIK